MNVTVDGTSGEGDVDSQGKVVSRLVATSFSASKTASSALEASRAASAAARMDKSAALSAVDSSPFPLSCDFTAASSAAAAAKIETPAATFAFAALSSPFKGE